MCHFTSSYKNGGNNSHLTKNNEEWEHNKQQESFNHAPLAGYYTTHADHSNHQSESLQICKRAAQTFLFSISSFSFLMMIYGKSILSVIKPKQCFKARLFARFTENNRANAESAFVRSLKYFIFILFKNV